VTVSELVERLSKLPPEMTLFGFLDGDHYDIKSIESYSDLYGHITYYIKGDC
jgi:hypothetical protein